MSHIFAFCLVIYALRTVTKTPHPEMEMVGVGGIVIRAEGIAEIAATGVQHRAQPRSGVGVFPAAQDRDPLPVLKGETADIQRLSASMFAAPGIGAMIDIPAGKAAEVLNARQAAAHHGFGQGPGLLGLGCV